MVGARSRRSLWLVLSITLLLVLIAHVHADDTPAQLFSASSADSRADDSDDSSRVPTFTSVKEAWRRGQEGFLRQVLSPPIASGVLAGEARPPPKKKAATSDAAVDQEQASNAQSHPARSVADFARELQEKPIRLVRIVTADVASGPTAAAAAVSTNATASTGVMALSDFAESALGPAKEMSAGRVAHAAALGEDEEGRFAYYQEAVRTDHADVYGGEMDILPRQTQGARLTQEVIVVPESGAMVSQKAIRVPITAVGSGYNIIQFDGYKDHVLTALVQLRSNRYDKSVPEDNCQRMYVTVTMQNNYNVIGQTTTTTTTTSTASPQSSSSSSSSAVSNDVLAVGESKERYLDDSGSSDTLTPTITTGSESAWAQIWNPIVQLFETSLFCQMVSSLSLRINDIPKTEPYYVVINSGMSMGYYDYTPEAVLNATCEMEVYLSQAPAKREKLLHVLFALVFPLIVLIVPLPFTLWRADLIQQLIGDVDFGEWLWFIPYYLRYIIIKGAVGAYNAIYEWRLERRTQAAQRELEARHRQIMRTDDNATSLTVVPLNGHNSANTTTTTTTRTDCATPKAEPPLLSGHDGRPAAALLDEEEENALRPRAPGQRTGLSHPLTGTARGDAASGAGSSTAADLAGATHAQAVGADLMDRFNCPASAATQPGARDGPHADPHVEREDSSAQSARSTSITVRHVEAGGDAVTAADPDITTVHVNAASAEDLSTDSFGRHRGAPSGRRFLFALGRDEEGAGEASAQPNNQDTRDSTRIAEGSTAESVTEPTMAREEVEAQSAQRAGHTVLHNNEEEEDEKVCRICRDGEEMEKLIAPCQCTGSVRWIHRSCLDHWRIESTKRNLSNVNNCEICKQPFNLGIKKSTLLWQSSRRLVRTLILILTSLIVFVLIVTLSHAVMGELACTGAGHHVAYSTMFSFENMIISVFHYSLIVFMVMFAHLIVYSWFRGRPEVEEYVNEMHLIPPFWTRWNAFRIFLVSLTLCAQAISVGFILKYIFYVTSNIAWNWEISPFLGSVGLIFVYSSSMGPAEALRDGVHAVRERRRIRRDGEVTAQDVTIEPAESDPAAPPQTTATAVSLHTHSSTPRPDGPVAAVEDIVDVNFTHHFSIPPEQRVIRATEYCPPRRGPPNSSKKE